MDVPFQVWDTENNRQLMLSFRDQADNGVFDLIGHFTSAEAGTQDDQSREYIFMHKYDYDDTNPHSTIAADGVLENGMLYFFWPYLQGGQTWSPDNLPAQTITIESSHDIMGVESVVENDCFPYSGSWYGGVPHVDHHALVTLPVPGSSDAYWILNANDEA